MDPRFADICKKQQRTKNMFYFGFQVDLTNLESKLRGLENDLLLNQKTIEKIKETVNEMQKEQVTEHS